MGASNSVYRLGCRYITPTGWLCYWHEAFWVKGEKDFTPTHFFLIQRLTGSFLKTQQHLLRAAATVISAASSLATHTEKLRERERYSAAVKRKRDRESFTGKERALQINFAPST